MYQRTANWCTPLNNRPISPAEQAQLRADRPWIAQALAEWLALVAHVCDDEHVQDHHRARVHDDLHRRDEFRIRPVSSASRTLWEVYREGLN